MESSNIKISGNTVDGAKYGVRLTMGSSDNQVYENTFDGISDGEVYIHTYSVRVELAPYQRGSETACACTSYSFPARVRTNSSIDLSVAHANRFICPVSATKALPTPNTGSTEPIGLVLVTQSIFPTIALRVWLHTPSERGDPLLLHSIQNP